MFICHKKTYLLFKKKTLFVWKPTVSAVMWIICMTTDSDNCHVDYFNRKVLYHFSLSKVYPQKTNLIMSIMFIMFITFIMIILFHTLSSSSILCHPLFSSFILFPPLSSFFIPINTLLPSFIFFHPLSFSFILFHPLWSSSIIFQLHTCLSLFLQWDMNQWHPGHGKNFVNPSKLIILCYH